MGVTRVARHSGHVIAHSLTWRRRYSSRQSGTAGFARDATRDAAASPHRETAGDATRRVRAASRVEEELERAGTRPRRERALISAPHTRGGSRNVRLSARRRRRRRRRNASRWLDRRAVAHERSGLEVALGARIGVEDSLAKVSVHGPVQFTSSSAKVRARSVASLAKGPDFFRSSSSNRSPQREGSWRRGSARERAPQDPRVPRRRPDDRTSRRGCARTPQACRIRASRRRARPEEWHAEQADTSKGGVLRCSKISPRGFDAWRAFRADTTILARDQG